MRKHVKYCPICDDYTMKRIKNKIWHYKCLKCGLRKQVLGIITVYDRPLPEKVVERILRKNIDDFSLLFEENKWYFVVADSRGNMVIVPEERKEEALETFEKLT